MSAFHGTGALLAHQLRIYRPMCLLLLGLAFVTGAFLRLGAADVDTIHAFLVGTHALALFLAPLLAGAGPPEPTHAYA